jgi:tRNA-dihydrouridine synthase
MKYSFAPMEGITLYPLRNTHKKLFGENVDKYYTPFVTATDNFHFKKREKRDILPEWVKNFDNYKEEIVPQIMAGNSKTFIWAARQMAELGYEEVNLNLGCPAATVTNRHKGSGLLTDTEYLDKMLGEIFEELGDEIRISLKTRLGFSDEKEALELMKVYAGYPISELIIHARVREDFYRGVPRLDAYEEAVKEYREKGGKAPISYNGDVTSTESLKVLTDNGIIGEDFGATSIMIGRGLLTNPALVRELCGGEPLSAPELKDYLEKLYAGYEEFIPEERNVIYKLLEHWAFLHVHFKNSEKCVKAIRKSRSKGEYMAAVNNIFSSCEFV